MPGTAITKAFLAVSTLGCCLTVIRLLYTRLSRRYRVFTLYLTFLAIDDVWPLLLPQRSELYFFFWVVTEPAIRIFCVFAVLELYRLMLERYKGLYSLGRWMMYGASVASVLVSIAMLLPHITPAMPERSVHLGYVFAFDRGVDFALTVFILLILVFLSQYPITLSRNLAVHATLYSIYFLSRGTYIMVRTAIWGHSAHVLDLVFSGIVAACSVAWFLLLSPKGEEVKAVRIHFSPEYEARVLEKLDALNQVLLKSSKS